MFDLAHKYKIRCSSFNIIGLPDEDREDIMKTIMLNRELNPTSATVTFFHPYRGAPLRSLCVERGYIPPNQGKHEDVYRSESQLIMPQITKEELRNLMSSFQLYMKLPEKYHDLIRKQEDTSSEESKEIREKILLPLFKKIQDSESKWDFRKKYEWWTSDVDGREEIKAKLKDPTPKPSMTTIDSIIDKGVAYEKWLLNAKDPYAWRDYKADLGTCVHNLIEILILSGECVITDEMKD